MNLSCGDASYHLQDKWIRSGIATLFDRDQLLKSESPSLVFC